MKQYRLPHIDLDECQMVLREIKKIQGNQIEAEKLSYRWEIDDYLLIFIHFVEGAHILPWLKSLI
ncbi:hypothetical protein [Shewanella benthica]|nr:hypothetical protein [Shewanella benthica]